MEHSEIPVSQNTSESEIGTQTLLTDQEVKDINARLPETFGIKNIFHLKVRDETIPMIKDRLTRDFGEDVAERAISAPHMPTLGIIGLYDGVYQQFSTTEPGSVIRSPLADAERGFVDVVRSGDSAIVIKDWAGSQEPTVAKIASDAKLGPHIYGPPVALVEDYLTEIDVLKLSPYAVAKSGGELLRGLHDHNIIYADTFVDHLRFDPRDNRIKLIDFGLSFQYDGATPIDQEYLWKVIDMMIPSGTTRDEYTKIRRDPTERARIASTPPERIKARELDRMINSLAYTIAQANNMPQLSDETVRFVEENTRAGYNGTQ
jgi:hypothetical protein